MPKLIWPSRLLIIVLVSERSKLNRIASAEQVRDGMHDNLIERPSVEPSRVESSRVELIATAIAPIADLSFDQQQMEMNAIRISIIDAAANQLSTALASLVATLAAHPHPHRSAVRTRSFVFISSRRVRCQPEREEPSAQRRGDRDECCCEQQLELRLIAQMQIDLYLYLYSMCASSSELNE